MDSWLWQAYADDSEDHANPDDPGVAAHIRAVRHDGELERLTGLGRDLGSLWEPAVMS